MAKVKNPFGDDFESNDPNAPEHGLPDPEDPSIKWGSLTLSELMGGKKTEEAIAAISAVIDAIQILIDILITLVEVVILVYLFLSDLVALIVYAVILLLEAVVELFIATSISMTWTWPKSYRTAPNYETWINSVADSMTDKNDPNRPFGNSEHNFFLIFAIVGAIPGIADLLKAWEVLMELFDKPWWTKNEYKSGKSWLHDALGDPPQYPPKSTGVDGTAPNWNSMRLADIKPFTELVNGVLKMIESLRKRLDKIEQIRRKVEIIKKRIQKIQNQIRKITALVKKLVEVAIKASGVHTLNIYGQGSITTQQAALLASMQVEETRPLEGQNFNQQLDSIPVQFGGEPFGFSNVNHTSQGFGASKVEATIPDPSNYEGGASSDAYKEDTSRYEAFKKEEEDRKKRGHKGYPFEGLDGQEVVAGVVLHAQFGAGGAMEAIVNILQMPQQVDALKDEFKAAAREEVQEVVDSMVTYSVNADKAGIDFGPEFLHEPMDPSHDWVSEFYAKAAEENFPLAKDDNKYPGGTGHIEKPEKIEQVVREDGQPLWQPPEDFGAGPWETNYDSDDDTIPDWQEKEMGTDPLKADTDDDGVLDAVDDFPLDASASLDSDSDGMPDTVTGTSTSDPPLVEDTDDDNDEVLDVDDAFPTDPNEQVDTDSDGVGDNADPDIDGDGTLNWQDAFPLDSSEDTDTDLDGIGDNADTDDDDDGVPDVDDDFPKDPDKS